MMLIKRFYYLIIIAGIAASCHSTDSNKDKTPAENAGKTITTLYLDSLNNKYESINSGFLGLSHQWGQAQLLMGSFNTLFNYQYLNLVKNITSLTQDTLSIHIGAADGERFTRIYNEDIHSLQDFFTEAKKQGVFTNYILGFNADIKSTDSLVQQLYNVYELMYHEAIKSVEINLDADNFTRQKIRDSAYNPNIYVQEFDNISTHIKNQVLGNINFTAAAYNAYSQSAADSANIYRHWHYLNQLKDAAGNSFNTIGTKAYLFSNDSANKVSLLNNPLSKQYTEWLHATLQWTKLHKKQLRLTEFNAINGGKPGISDTYESALWLLETLCQLAYAGVDGVNIHSNNWSKTYGWDVNAAFRFNVPRAAFQKSHTIPPPKDLVFEDSYGLQKVLPVYYGMYVFADATKGKAKLMPVNISNIPEISTWLFETPQNTHQLLLINKSETPQTLNVHLGSYLRNNSVNIKKLQAPALLARDNITYAGRTFDGSTTGDWMGEYKPEKIENIIDKTIEATINPYQVLLIEF
ncbi:glycosyl hydrolase family 79 C-terminal domain-containing protein [Polluticaenibacter yanchengensis]|uniref:Glycosyl hydrolase family 79 C-terminal domain-containing protein n=1 Tax=Polluticaenibacter yanchengensis TaxID=3014562 RepID=A0ABT4URH1_9BACT|nr:glycosyl hydrolase family 79 C-terminal domain-containing protein [Chitinophagaceae bacterium LY-5]